jgi:hypothetical protein
MLIMLAGIGPAQPERRMPIPGDETPLRLPCDRIVTHRIPSESTRDAMAIMQSGEIMAAVVSLRGLSSTDRAL